MKANKDTVVIITLDTNNNYRKYAYKVIDTTVQEVSDSLDKLVGSKDKYIDWDHHVIFPKKRLVSFEIMTYDDYKELENNEHE